MVQKDPVCDEIIKMLAERGPMGWYAMERRLRIPRHEFHEGYTLMTYLNNLEEAGFIAKTEDGKYKVA
ncbi:helix-turn-helix domain-containing protein [Roseobacter weihaiensis]|uniref:helix-turn-helix domain-containing protein n=1 Tax=Roseobacter weihaiensis TaxID=2763262 RepID=UPI001D0B8898|nr:helix-turn-helix domain-containing protein [Roseobacter sp. H9]